MSRLSMKLPLDGATLTVAIELENGAPLTRAHLERAIEYLRLAARDVGAGAALNEQLGRVQMMDLPEWEDDAKRHDAEQLVDLLEHQRECTAPGLLRLAQTRAVLAWRWNR